MIQSVSNGYTALSAKLDTAHISQTMAAQTLTQQVADVQRVMSDHEARLRAQEFRPYVSPRSIWGGISVIVAALGLIFTIVQIMMK
jgi:hypothetical protein